MRELLLDLFEIIRKRLSEITVICKYQRRVEVRENFLKTSKRYSIRIMSTHTHPLMKILKKL